MKRLILLLIRKKLGVKKYQRFQFKNQKSATDMYYIDDCAIMKVIRSNNDTIYTHSRVSLNWLLDDVCDVEKID